MNLPRIFYDPDNPYSRFVWGVEPGLERMRRKAKNEFWILSFAISSPPVLMFSIYMLVWPNHRLSDFLEFVRMGLGLSWFTLVCVVFGSLVETKAPRALRGTEWRDLRLAGLTGRQILLGNVGRTLYAIVLATVILTAGCCFMQILAAADRIQSIVHLSISQTLLWYYLEPNLRFIGLYLAVAFFLLSTVVLDIGMWVRHPHLLPRMAAWAGLLLCSPRVWLFALALHTGSFRFDLHPAAYFMLEILSWPARGWIVWRVWRNAIRTLDEDDVP